MKTWYKKQNASEWCIYYATTDKDGRIYKNFVCECESEAEADNILSLQLNIFLIHKICQDKNNTMKDIADFIKKKMGDQFLIEMEASLITWLKNNDKLP